MNIKDSIIYAGNKIIDNKDYLTELDQAIGDGDHGINMARGFENVIAKLNELPADKTPADIFKLVGMTLLGKVGGASGPLYGTAFLRAANVLKDKNELTPEVAIAILEAAIKGIQDRGKAVENEKTMLDVLIPVKNSLIASQEHGEDILTTWKKAAEVANTSAEHTKELLATKGRASYLQERSIGHQDPGATSSALMINSIYECLQKGLAK